MALIDGSPRMADAATVSASDLLMLDREEFTRAVEMSPKIAFAVMASLAERLRSMGDHLEARQGQDVLGRVAGALEELARSQGVAQASGAIRIEARVTHQELADQVGATRESVSRALAQLRQARALKMDARTFIVTSLVKLSQMRER